jgi:hypothetical protein
MQHEACTGVPSETEMASWSARELISLVQSLTNTIESLQHRIEWFERNLFGTKSERLRVLENTQQLSLGEALGAPEREEPAKERPVAGYTRRSTARDAAADEAEGVPFFDESRVPVETIELKPRNSKVPRPASSRSLARRSPTAWHSGPAATSSSGTCARY